MVDYKEVANSGLMFLLCALVIVVVVVQSLVLMRAAWKRGKAINIPPEKMKKAMANSAIVSIVPSLPILIFLIMLMPGLGNYFPWLRLSVVGSGTYESMAADIAAKAQGLESIIDPRMNLSSYAIVMVVMTVGIIWGLLTLLFGSKYLDTKLNALQGKNKELFPIIISSIFVSMLCIFTAPYFVNVGNTAGRVSAVVVVIAAVSSLAFGYCAKKYKLNFLKEFSLPLCMVVGMLSALLLTNIL